MNWLKVTVWTTIALILTVGSGFAGRAIQSQQLTEALESERQAVKLLLGTFSGAGHFEIEHVEASVQASGYFRCNKVGANADVQLIECVKPASDGGIMQSFKFKLCIIYNKESNSLVYSAVNLDSSFVSF